jgi:hypothetical protein
MNKRFTLTLVLALVLILSVAVFAACNNKDTNVTSYPIPEGLAVSVEIYEGDTLLGTVNKDTLGQITQYRVTMTTTNAADTVETRNYIAYKLTDIAAKLEITLPETITKVAAFATDNYKDTYDTTTLANAYISIGFEDDGVFAEDSKAPRFISDSTSTSANSVAKFIGKIVINPVDKTRPVLHVTMTQGDKTNEITVPNAIYEETVENVSEEITKSGVTTVYYGFNLIDILNSMGKIRNNGEWMGFISDYVSVGFVCSDDEADGDYSARVFTKSEIEDDTKYIKIVRDGDTARCYSDLADAQYRSRLKNITQIIIYGEDAATLVLSWSYAE